MFVPSAFHKFAEGGPKAAIPSRRDAKRNAKAQTKSDENVEWKKPRVESQNEKIRIWR